VQGVEAEDMIGPLSERWCGVTDEHAGHRWGIKQMDCWCSGGSLGAKPEAICGGDYGGEPCFLRPGHGGDYHLTHSMSLRRSYKPCAGYCGGAVWAGNASGKCLGCFDGPWPKPPAHPGQIDKPAPGLLERPDVTDGGGCWFCEKKFPNLRYADPERHHPDCPAEKLLAAWRGSR